MTSRAFDLGDVLSITTGRLVSPRHMDGIYDTPNFMTGDNLFTHQLPRASDECRPALFAQHPQLLNVDFPDKFEDKEHVEDWLFNTKLQYGETLEVSPLAEGSHEFRDPLAEADQMMGTRPVIVVRVGE